MKTISAIILLFSLTLLLSSCMNNNKDEIEKNDIYIETTDWWGAGVPVQSQKWSR